MFLINYTDIQHVYVSKASTTHPLLTVLLYPVCQPCSAPFPQYVVRDMEVKLLADLLTNPELNY